MPRKAVKCMDVFIHPWRDGGGHCLCCSYNMLQAASLSFPPTSSFFSHFLSLLVLFLPLLSSSLLPPFPVSFLFPLFHPSYRLSFFSNYLLLYLPFHFLTLEFSYFPLLPSSLVSFPFLSPLLCFLLFVSLCLTGQEISLISALISSDQTCRSQSAPSD